MVVGYLHKGVRNRGTALITGDDFSMHKLLLMLLYYFSSIYCFLILSYKMCAMKFVHPDFSLKSIAFTRQHNVYSIVTTKTYEILLAPASVSI